MVSALSTINKPFLPFSQSCGLLNRVTKLSTFCKYFSLNYVHLKASSKISQKSGNLVFLISVTHVQALWGTFFTATNTRLSDWIKIIQLKPRTKVDHLPVHLLRDGRRSVWED